MKGHIFNPGNACYHSFQNILSSHLISINVKAKSFYLLCLIVADPNGRAVWGKYCLRPLEHWDRRFECCSGYGCVSAFFCLVLCCVVLCCVVLSCVGRGLASSRYPVQEVLPTVQIDS
jgi:hypothetical protein